MDWKQLKKYCNFARKTKEKCQLLLLAQLILGRNFKRRRMNAECRDLLINQLRRSKYLKILKSSSNFEF